MSKSRMANTLHRSFTIAAILLAGFVTVHCDQSPTAPDPPSTPGRSSVGGSTTQPRVFGPLRHWGTFTTNHIRGTAVLEICVRDRQCEDGDVIQLEINGASIKSYELFNRRQCDRWGFSPGQNTIGIVAVNGTGFKGACSFADRNTGQITVSSIGSGGVVDRSKSQTFDMEGGAGSRAGVNVVLR